MSSQTQARPAKAGAIHTRLFAARQALVLSGDAVQAAEILIENQRADREQLRAMIETDVLAGRIDGPRAERAKELLDGEAEPFARTLAHLTEDAADMDARVSGHAMKLQTITARLEGVGMRFDSLEQRLDKLEELEKVTRAAADMLAPERMLPPVTGPVARACEKLDLARAELAAKELSVIPPPLLTSKILPPDDSSMRRVLEAQDREVETISKLVQALNDPRVVALWIEVHNLTTNRRADVRLDAFKRMKGAAERFAVDSSPERRALVSELDRRLATLAGEE